MFRPIISLLFILGAKNMAEETSQKIQTVKSSGIPKAEFVGDVDEFMKRPGNETAEVVLKSLEEQHQKYKFMEYNLVTKKNRLKGQIPDIKTSLDIVKHMKTKKDSSEALKTNFQIADNLYVKGKIPPTDKVLLWLGANVMLEYTLDEADVLLTKNLEAAQKQLEDTIEDIGFLKDQSTTTEVNMARVYNWDVKRRQSLKESGKS